MISGEDMTLVAPPEGQRTLRRHANETSRRSPDLVCGVKTAYVCGLAEQGLPGTRVIGMGLIRHNWIYRVGEAGASASYLKRTSTIFWRPYGPLPGTKVLPPSLAGSLFSHVIENALRKGRKSDNCGTDDEA